MADTSLVEIVKFKAEGLERLTAETEALGAAADEAAKKEIALAGATTDGFAGIIAKMQEAGRLATEAADRRAQESTRLTRLYGDLGGSVDKAERRNAALAKAMRDGTHARATQELSRLNREYEKLNKQAELSARFGSRIGEFLARPGVQLAGRVAGGVAAATAAVGTGLASRGLQGTVEGTQKDLETKMLAREMAGIFRPVTNATTALTRTIRQGLEKTDAGGQNALLAGLGIAGAWGLHSFFTGGLVRSLALGGAAAAAPAAAGAGGAAAAAAGAGGAAAGAAAAGGAPLLLKLGPLAALAYGGYRVHEDADRSGGGFGDYARSFTERGMGRFPELGINPTRWASRQVGLEGALDDRMNQFFGWFGAKPRTAESENVPHRTTQVSGGGFGEAGEAYQRLNEAISRVENERDRTEGGSDAATNARVAEALEKLNAYLDRADTPDVVRRTVRRAMSGG